MLIEINNKTKQKIDKKKIINVVEVFLKKHQRIEKMVSLAIIGDMAMQKLNRRYRDIDRPTDILSFSEDEESAFGETDMLGELVVDIQQIKRQSVSSGRKEEEELVFIIVHGLLHLIGFDDKTEKDRLKMIEMGEEFLQYYSRLSRKQKSA